MTTSIHFEIVFPIIARALRNMTAVIETALVEIEAARESNGRPVSAPAHEPGHWNEVEIRHGIGVTWPAKGGGSKRTEFEPFVVYQGDSDGTKFGLGFDPNSGAVAVCRIGSRDSVRPITYFQPTKTGELIAPVRRLGSRSYLKPGDALYSPYDADFRVEPFRKVIPGYRNDILGVVVAKDDVQTMLNHGAIQARLRGH